MQHFPVFQASESQKAPIVDRVRKILIDPDISEIPIIEEEINRMVYELYELTPEEIAIVVGREK